VPLKIETKYDIGEKVILKHDTERLLRMVTGISIRPNGHSYNLISQEKDSWHYEFEIERESVKSKAGFITE